MWFSLRQWEKVAVTCIASMLVGGASWLGYRSMTAPGTSAQASHTRTEDYGAFPVHVTGAVKSPSVIAGDEQMLVQDAIDAAGGSTPNADLSRLNLAARLEPNSRLYVPELGERVDDRQLGSYGPSGGPSSPSSAPARPLAGGKININSASDVELERLPGIGPVLAKRIVEYRNGAGGFRTIDQLVEVKGIGPKKLEQIRPHVTL